MTYRFESTTALLVVDVQNDFTHPDGNLYVEGAEEIVPLVNQHIVEAREAGALVVHTQDWHPPSTPHFESDGGVWPEHCVQGTWGAELHADLHTGADVILRKGTGGEDGYSAFSIRHPETSEERSLGLHALLEARGIRKVVVVGLAADVCVKETALDAASMGLETVVLSELTRPVDPDSADAAYAEMAAAGVEIV